ncbi:LacI family DNA-binding transcriptional regulator [Pseudomonas sp. CCI3.2]|uniref:LacI family DNA-binding transcriptional regulator n=1 Tax=unclassified Pseudomonas TaxID=196821 RepID=UPI002AC927B0|nr:MULTISPECIES: LacI family DNA-binding transcriptional regulator [unclassified Pseudomonas]MEB0077688.1 LacI family DNA-binding transcriptional regulator [Pseudomonas sp. MH10out]MEB0090892.1 LacI family DNA-binding transcriptional regulator [Pseudomonas sp. CCI4.2]MEB0101318.1 LacI family DNA-binding transcriptional regulator [Pseudomonas sp. CCI3.2]MEB0131425.1 LacI family DNA-binding transcriptional regulator [Pseudomonas sp. CCI2.4]MEB0158435.1 LacI family DNA-binding transcriptional reg
MVTMDDVAKLAKVSTSTVSHVLNGTRKVSPITARAVESAVQYLDYIPNTLARSLARSTTNTIGVAISALSNHYFSETVHAIETESAKHGIMMLFVDTHDDPEQELRVVKALHHRRVDGILLAPSMDTKDHRTLAYLQANEIPTVLVDRLAAKGFDQVGVENKRSSQALVAHLIEHGHRRIACVAGRRGFSTTEERIDGYRAALSAAGLPFDPALLVNGESSSEPARLATGHLLALASPPTAIMAANNMMTIGAMHALRDAGIGVPEQMALVGFDDFDWADFFVPRLTVVAQPVEALGARAVKLLLKRIESPEGKRQTVRLPPTLRIRNSCGCR